MKNSAERIRFICDYIYSYENKIKELNKQGLFDAAKEFEIFASRVGQLFLGLEKPLKNLNTYTFTFPGVDLFSEDNNTFCQVSTCQDIPKKISNTLQMINKSSNELLKSIKEVYFIVLSNDSINKVKDIKKGKITFNKNKHLITTSKIIEKAKNDIDFQEKLYLILKTEDDLFKTEFDKYIDAIHYKSKTIIDDINTFINNRYYIDISNQVNKILNDNKKFSIVIGEAGSGKSVLCKKVIEKKNNVLCARAETLIEQGEVDKIWGFNFNKVLSLIKDEVFIYIDALEFIADNITKIDILETLFKKIQELDNVSILCSCRTSDLNSFLKLIGKYKFTEYKTTPISKSKLQNIINEFPMISKISNDNHYNSLLTNPFYINFLTQIEDFNSIDNENQLRKKIWKDIICLKNENIEQLIFKIVLDRAKNFNLYANISNYDKKTIDKLISSNILIKNENGIRLKYDIFEDICFEQFIDELFYKSKGNYNYFFCELEKIGRCIYRRYQIWVENKLFSNANREKFLLTLVSTTNIPNEWKKETIKGIIRSSYCQDFFDEYSNIIENDLLKTFIDLTNIYGFEIDELSYNLETFILKNKGVGREKLIELIYKKEIYKENNFNELDIKKLIYDYSNNCSNDNISFASYKILEFFIEEKMKNNCSYDLIKKNVETIYKFYKVSNEWIEKYFLLIEIYLQEQDYNKTKFAKESIEDIISNNCLCLIQSYLPKVLFFYKTYYTHDFNQKKKSFYHNEKNNEDLWGLNNNAKIYENKNFNSVPKLKYIIFGALYMNFWVTFKWYLQFVNDAITIFKSTKKLNKYKILLSNSTKEFYGTDEMWYTGEYRNKVPTLISDMTYIVKSSINEFVKKFTINEKTTFLNSIKKEIYENSNNIITLSIISNLGLKYMNEIPEFCIELISSIEIVLADLDRFSFQINIPIKKMFEEEISKKVGIPNLTNNKYKDVSAKIDLKSYAILIQQNKPNLKKDLYKIFDYLYTIINNTKEQAILFLQLKHMDLRDPYINGEAKKIIDKNDSDIKKSIPILNTIENINKLIINNQLNVIDIDNLIDMITSNENNPLYIQNINFLISCIVFAFSKLNISIDKRNEYCELWLKYAYKKMNNEPIIITSQFFYSLFDQINYEINFENKNKIKRLILEILLSQDHTDGTIYELYLVAKNFLKNNEQIKIIFLNTILNLAKDEMLHQKFNYEYMLNHHKEEIINFESNLQPKFKGVDYIIEQDGEKQYKSKKDEIINKYLYNEQNYTIDQIDLSLYDMEIIGHIFSFDLDLEIPKYTSFIRNYLELMIKFYQKKEYSYYDIISFTLITKIEEYFKQCLLSEKRYQIILELLFKGIDFSLFNREMVDFYINILASLTPYYIQSFNNKNQRKHIENVINLMEKYINEISNEWIKNELSIALILGFNKYWRVDLSKENTKYDYLDKMFLNKIFSKYGHKHFYDMLIIISQLQYNKLLPEILISIQIAFKNYIIELKSNPQVDSNEINNIKAIINQIIYFAFINYEQEIKSDNELIDAYEGILQNLIDINDEKAAILLDEFRIH